MTTSYSGDPASSGKDAVRFYIQDTAAPWKLTDEEINWVISQYPSVLFAAAQCARTVAGKYASQATSKRVGDLAITYTNIADQYRLLAEQLESQAEMTGVGGYAGGISKADMCAVNANSDRVPTSFDVKQFDIPKAADATLLPDAETDW